MKKISVSFLLIVSLLSAGFAQEVPKNLSLNQCIEIALKNNLDVLRSGIAANNAQVDLQQSRANFLPSLNAGITHGLNQGRSIDPLTNTYVDQEVYYARPSVNGSLMLFNGLALQNLLKRNSLAYQASKQEEQRAKDDLTLQVILAYLQVLTFQDIVSLAQSQLETTSAQVDRLEILNTNGNIAPANYFDLKGQYSNDKLSIINNGNLLQSYKIALARLMNVPYDKESQFAQLSAEEFSLVYEITPEQVYASAMENLAMVKAVDLREKSAGMNVKANRAGFFPSVFFDAGWGSNFSNAARDPFGQRVGYFQQFNNNLSKSYSVGVSIPIFNSFRTKNQVTRAKLAYRETQLISQTTKTQLQQLTEEAYLNMTASRERYQSLKEQSEAYTEAFRTMEIRFNAGAVNSVDYLVAKTKMDRANIDILTNRYDFILRKKILDFYQGKLSGF